MKKSIRIILLSFSVMFFSCEKEPTGNNSSFISFVESDIDYFTRSCFQLSDGSFIICGSNVPYTNNVNGFIVSSDVKSKIAKVSETGDLIWTKDLPGNLYDLSKAIPLHGGGFALAGYDSVITGRNLTVSVYDDNGNLVKSNTLLDPNAGPSPYPALVDIIQLRNGNFAIAANTITGSTYFYPRLLVLDPELNVVTDKKYSSLVVNNKNYHCAEIREGSDGNIYYLARRSGYNVGLYIRNFTSLLKFNGATFDLDMKREFIGEDSTEAPGGFVFDDRDQIAYITAEQFNSNLLNQRDYFYLHNEEYFSIGKSVSVIRTDTAGNFIDRFNFSGFPLNGTLAKIEHTSDGGYIMAGTCNQEDNFSLASTTRILLVKTDASFNQQWMKIINSTYPSYGFDINQTNDGGFLIGAIQKSFNKNFKMMLIKTDNNGN
jgi:hypothetical protein